MFTSRILRPTFSTAPRHFARRPPHRAYRTQYQYKSFNRGPSLLRRWAARPTFYYEVIGLGGVCGGYYIANLETVPVSGRRRFNVVGPATEKMMGEEMYRQTLQEYRGKILPAGARETRMVRRVLERLVPHSGLEGEGLEGWEVFVIEDGMANAFVVPGGKVFVFKGILDLCGGEDGLAAVLGHEIAHNVCHHAAERTSQAFWLAPLGILAFFLTGIDPRFVSWGTDLAFTLPGSRKQEEEADYVGLLMMAESCYDPSAAMGLWARMQKAEKGAPPQFLSTHPSSHNRLEKIRGWLAEAEEKRENAGCAVTAGYAKDFRSAMDFTRW